MIRYVYAVKHLLAIKINLLVIVWSNALLFYNDFNPIPLSIAHSPYVALHFYSDAAGPKKSLTLQNDWVFDLTLDPGAASVGFSLDPPFSPYFCSIITWPPVLLSLSTAHSTLFEFFNLLLPFAGLKRRLTGFHIILHVDNTACIDIWKNKYCKHSELVSVFVQCLHVLEAALECRIFLEHSPRRSSLETILVDNLSRRSTTSPDDLLLLTDALHYQPRGPLLDWLLSPTPDWSLPRHLAQYVLSETI